MPDSRELGFLNMINLPVSIMRRFLERAIEKKIDFELIERMVSRLLRPESDQLIDKIIDLVISEAGRFYTFTVDFDDPKWRKPPVGGNYSYVNPANTAVHFPIRFSGKAEVVVELVQYHKGMTYAGHLAVCKDQNALEIDRPITETFHELYPNERLKGWILSLCGVEHESAANRVCYFIEADMQGLSFCIDWVNTRLDRERWFLVLREMKPLAN